MDANQRVIAAGLLEADRRYRSLPWPAEVEAAGVELAGLEAVAEPPVLVFALFRRLVPIDQMSFV